MIMGVPIDRRIVRVGIVVIALVVVAVLTVPITLTPRVRARLTAALNERFESQVELRSLRVSVLPRARVAGEGVLFRHKGRTDVPPLITVQSFAAEATLWGLIGGPVHLTRLQLEGLEVNVPPGGTDLGGVEEEKPGQKEKHQKEGGRAPHDTEPEVREGREPQRDAPEGDEAEDSPIIVDELLSENAVLRILRRQADKPARTFRIHHLSMQNTGSNVPWAFNAMLTNPTPPGRIEARGTFGPWHAAEPSQTPLEAAYEFREADLGVFGGIQGTLGSKGRFEGVLERIEVEGRADVPRFALQDVGHSVSLETRFHAIVDGTSGNTWLRPVNATLGRSAIRASGGVVEREGKEGRTVTLDVAMEDARVEDVLRLALKADEPPMTGALSLKTKFRLPPGDAEGIERLELDGAFEIARARFTAGKVQAKVDELSQKARGESEQQAEEEEQAEEEQAEEEPADEKEDPEENVVSDFKGRFVMSGGVIRFSSVSFAVPGARVDLGGRYTLQSEALDFRGTVRLDAKLSQLTTGAKSFFLKLIEPLFRRGEVTEVPITIQGTVDDPQVGLDVGRAVSPG